MACALARPQARFPPDEAPWLHCCRRGVRARRLFLRPGGCDRELYANADGRVYACQPAVSRVMRGAPVGGPTKGSRPCYKEETVAPRIGETPMQRLRRLHAAHQLEARQFDLFHPRAREPHWLQSPKDARETVVNLMARILREHVSPFQSRTPFRRYS